MKIGEEHCRDRELYDVQGNVPMPRIGRMRRLQLSEHAACMCGGAWAGNGFTRIVGNKLLEHLVCTRCGYRWIADHHAVKAGFAVPE